MISTNGNNHLTSRNASWELISEASLAANKPTTDQKENWASMLLGEAARELGLPLSHFERVKESLEDAASKVTRSNTQTDSDLQISIRLYIQNNAKEEHLQGAENTGLIPPEKAMKSSREDPDCGRGWGYFLTERLVKRSTAASGGPHYSIEVFLYKEGD